MRRVLSNVELEEDDHGLDSCNIIYGKFGNSFFYLKFFVYFFVLFCLQCVLSYIYLIITLFDNDESPSRFFIVSQIIVHLVAIAIILTNISNVFLIAPFFTFVFINCLNVIGSRVFLYQHLFFVKDGKLFKATMDIDNLIFSIQQKEDIIDIEIDDEIEIMTQYSSCNVSIDELEDIQGEIYGI